MPVLRGLLSTLCKREGSWSRSLACFPLCVPLQMRPFVPTLRRLELGLAGFPSLQRCPPAQPVLGTACAWSHPPLAGSRLVAVLSLQAAEMDGFQADTEEDEEDDDCMIVDVQPGKGGKQNGSQALGRHSPQGAGTVCS